MNGCVFLFPGQGSQSVGMGRDLCDRFPAVNGLFDQASDILKMDMKKLCFEGPESVLAQTENVQPAITLVNLACSQVLRDDGIVPSASAGHSLGEYAALYAAGVFSFADTLKLVRARGLFMKEAAERNPGGMVAVIGLGVDRLNEICEKVRDVGSVEVANHNSPRQVILTGEHEALKRASEIAKQEGAKLIVPLKVSGPWHSRFMQSASQRMEEVLKTCAFGRPAIPVVSNVTAGYFNDPEEIRTGLVRQIVRPVQWAASMERLVRDGYRLFVEAGPGKVLTGLMRDISREVRVINVENADGMAKVKAVIAESIPPSGPSSGAPQ